MSKAVIGTGTEASELPSAVAELTGALGRLIEEGSAALSANAQQTYSRDRVWTTANGIYPQEEVPEGTLRGVNDVRASLRSHGRSTIEPGPPDLARSAIYLGFWEPDRTGDAASWPAIHEALTKITDAILHWPRLRDRVHEYTGARTADLPDREKYFSELDETGRAFLIVPLLASRIRAAVAAVGQHWGEVADVLLDDLNALANRAEAQYILRGYLNSPPIRPNDAHAVVTVDIVGNLFEVTLKYASDRLLGKALEDLAVSAMPIALARANSVTEVSFSVPTGLTTEEAAPYAERAAELLLHVEDALRLSQGEDLGMVMIAQERLDWCSPRLPEDSFWSRNEAASIFIPRRGYFGTPRPEPLTVDEADALRTLVARLAEGVGVAGFDVAMRRFRATYDRYAPGEDEFLLDAAIALEALFLSDGDNKELRYRLSNRAARFLAETVETRRKYAKIFRNLYDIRSKIAHGEDFSNQDPKSKKFKKLLQAHLAGGPLLRTALRRFAENGGPRNQQEARAFWERVELE